MSGYENRLRELQERSSGSISPEQKLKLLQDYIIERDGAYRSSLTNLLPGRIPTEEAEAAAHVRNMQALAKSVNAWQRRNTISGIDAFYASVLDAYAISDSQERAKALSELRELLSRQLGPNFTSQDIDAILQGVYDRREEYRGYLHMRQYASLAEFQNGRYFNEVRGLINNNTIANREKEARIRSLYLAAATAGHKPLQELLATEEGVSRSFGVIAARERARERPREVRENTDNRLAIIRAQFNLLNLSPAGLGIIQSLIQQGGGDLAWAMITSTDLRATSEGLIGSIEGEQIFVETGARGINCYLLQGGDRIPLQAGLGAGAFTDARFTKIGRETSSRFLESSSLSRDGIFQQLAGTSLGTGFMDSRRASVTEELARTMLRDRGSLDEERAAMRQLRLLQENNEPNQRYVAWWAIEFRYLLEQSQGQALHTIVHLGDLARVAERWHREQKFSLISLSDLLRNPAANGPRETGLEVARQG